MSSVGTGVKLPCLLHITEFFKISTSGILSLNVDAQYQVKQHQHLKVGAKAVSIRGISEMEIADCFGFASIELVKNICSLVFFFRFQKLNLTYANRISVMGKARQHKRINSADEFHIRFSSHKN